MPEVITIIVDTTETIDINQSPSDPVAIISQIGSTGPPGQDGVSGATLHAELTDTDTDGHPASAITGLGGAAVLNVGTTTGTVAAGNDSRFTDSRTPTAHASSHAEAGSDPITSLGPLTLTGTLKTTTVDALTTDGWLYLGARSSGTGGGNIYQASGYYGSAAHAFHSYDGGAAQVTGVRMTGYRAASIGLTVKGAASQSASLQEWHDSAGTYVARISSDGTARFLGTGVMIGGASGGTVSVNNGDLTLTNNGSGYGVRIRGGGYDGAGITLTPFGGTALAPTSTEAPIVAQVLATFNPTSGPATFKAFEVKPTINQTGGASGITRGIHVNPTLTAAADFRAIEMSNTTGYGIYQSGAADNYFTGNIRAPQYRGTSLTRPIINGYGGIDFQFYDGGTGYFMRMDNSITSGATTAYAWHAAYTPFSTRGAASQTAALQNWLDSAGTVLSSITAAGLHKWSSGNEQTTVGAAGAASALPASPTKYLKIVGSDGVTYVIPAFAAS